MFRQTPTIKDFLDSLPRVESAVKQYLERPAMFRALGVKPTRKWRKLKKYRRRYHRAQEGF